MRVVRTFAFLDLCGFTAYTDEHGDREAVAVLAHLRTLLRAKAEDHGVRVTKWLGDGAMMSGIKADAVLQCVLEVREAIDRDGTLRLRGGVCEGPVIMFEGDDYIGEAVNVAARLCQRAAPGEILVTVATVSHAGGDPPPEERRRIQVSGISEQLEVQSLPR